MSAVTLPPPRPPECLTRSYLSRRIKGGTIIAEDVVELDEHLRRVGDPDGYRLDSCGNCGHEKMHAHCCRERKLRGADARQPPLSVEIRLYRCASCGAVFTILPAFVARHLWRAWKTVERASAGQNEPPRSTLARWRARLKSDASQLVQLFVASVQAGAVSQAVVDIRPRVRSAFVAVLGPLMGGRSGWFARIAAWIHRLGAGVRLM